MEDWTQGSWNGHWTSGIFAWIFALSFSFFSSFHPAPSVFYLFYSLSQLAEAFKFCYLIY